MNSDSMRLHVTPLDPDLLRAVVGPRLLESVSNISYHTLQTFPESSYGYLELPTMEAEKIKKKLNGAILKGKKIKVEEARPTKRRRIEEPVEKPAIEAPATKVKKSKKDRNVISGHELEANRKVKRGWTEAKATKSGKRSKDKSSQYTDKDELLFRTKLPANKMDLLASTKQEKAKSKKKKNDGEHVVHEFEKATIYPTFLKQDTEIGMKGNLHYVEGQGWVDEAGKVVEKEGEGVRRQRDTIKPTSTSNRKPTDPPAYSPVLSESTTDEDDVEDEDETSSSGASSDFEIDTRPQKGVSATDDHELASAKDPDPSQEQGPHPLEALFKKPKKPASQDVAKPSLEIATSFSFFGSGNDNDMDEEPSIPGTPYSSQDMHARALRSAAPTPDTAHPSRFNSYGSSGLPGDEESEEDEEVHGEPSSSPRRASAQKQLETPSRQQSEFEKKFWEKRSENNRSWKLRRRTVLKEKRQRENKARRPRNW